MGAFLSTLSQIASVIRLVLQLGQVRPAPAADEMYKVVPLADLWGELRRPGTIRPQHVDRCAADSFRPQAHRWILVTGPPETGKTFEALRCIERACSELTLADLHVLLPQALTLPVPEKMPTAWRHHLVLLLDDLHGLVADNPGLGQDLLAVTDFLTRNLSGLQFLVVATAREGHLPALQAALGGGVLRLFEQPPHGCHIYLTELEGAEEQACLKAIGQAFNVDVGDDLAAKLAIANDGTLVAAYDFIHKRSEESHALAEADIPELQRQVSDHWRGTVLPTLSPRQQRIIECLSVLRSCRVPMHEWIVHEMIRHGDEATKRRGHLRWYYEAARLRQAADGLRQWVPLSDDHVFTPHDARLDLDRDILADAVTVAAALLPLCDDRPVRDGLREAYASAAAVLQAREEYATVVPVLVAWRRTSTGRLKGEPTVALPGEQLHSTVTGEPQQGTAAWAAHANTAGIRWCELPTGGQAANLRQAIACYEAALRIRTEQDFPQDWAATQNNLGNAHLHRPDGDRAENLRQAIMCYQNALRVRTEQDSPQDWATTQNNLGNAYADLPSRNRAGSLRQAIECYRNALRLRTEQDSPQEWAMTQNNLGTAYADLPDGDRATNLKQAIACYEAALRIRDEQSSPHDWAVTQNNMGNAYTHLPTGDRATNLRRAIACYEAALRVHTEKDFPRDWATAQNNLGVAYDKLPAGDRAENVRCAIECYQNALRVRTEHDSPRAWATTQNNLGIAYRNLPSGDRSANLRQAIACYEAALRVHSRRDFPQDWALTTENAANVYLDENMPGDRCDNLREAERLLREALRLLTAEAYPHNHAKLLRRLADVATAQREAGCPDPP